MSDLICDTGLVLSWRCCLTLTAGDGARVTAFGRHYLKALPECMCARQH